VTLCYNYYIASFQPLRFKYRSKDRVSKRCSLLRCVCLSWLRVLLLIDCFVQWSIWCVSR